MGLPAFTGGATARAFARAASAAARLLAILAAAILAQNALAGDDSASGSAASSFAENAFDSIINKVAEKYSIDPLLIKAVIWNESRFKPRSTGSAGEIGLMQLKACAIKDWLEFTDKPAPSKEELYDPYLNIEIGTWFLARAMTRWDGKRQCYTLALCEYNAGRSRAVVWQSRAGRDSDVPIASLKTRRYVASVRDKYIEYSAANAAFLAANLPSDIMDRQSLSAIQQ